MVYKNNKIYDNIFYIYKYFWKFPFKIFFYNFCTIKNEFYFSNNFSSFFIKKDHFPHVPKSKIGRIIHTYVADCIPRGTV